MSTRPPRPPYAGEDPQLVIAIDVGTTFSAASYAILKPNQAPKIFSVSKFEGQEDQSGSNKTPSVLHYDPSGVLIACGPLANELDEDEGGTRVEWFKLLLRPASLKLDLGNAPLTQVPPDSNLVRIFGDFLKYMKSCVQQHVRSNFVDGREIWESLIDSARYILSHPNGWEGLQQNQMRTAAILGRLVPDTPEGRERIEFVSEGEANFHSCIDVGLADAALSLGSHIVIADAGGGTIDVSSFRITSLLPLRLQETSASACELAGSVFVTKRFETAMREKLQGSKSTEEEHIEELIKVFDQTTKRLFRDADAPKYIKMGNRRHNDAEFNIKSGQIMVPGDVIAATFEPSCDAAARAIQKLVDGNRNAHVFLTGGFGASPWLHSELRRQLSDVVKDLKHDDSNGGKAVAHGAIAYYLDHLVHARVAKRTIGMTLAAIFDWSDPLHRERRARVVRSSVTGFDTLPGAFHTIINKGEVLSEDAEYRTQYTMSTNRPYGFPELDMALEEYTGALVNIPFRDMDRASYFRNLCKFYGSASPRAFVQRWGTFGPYSSVNLTVVLNLGKTELTCYLEWDEEGETKRGPTTSIWEGSDS